MELKQLMYFTVVAEEGSISAAARKLNLSQPPLSTSMKQLEEEYGVILFERGARGISLTHDGEVLYRYANEMLELRNRAEEELQKKPAVRRQPIRLGLISSYDSRIFYDGLQRFQKQYPDTVFRIQEGNTFAVLDLLNRGKIDLGVIRTPYPDAGMEAIRLSSDRIAAYGTAVFDSVVQKKHLRLKDLADQPLIVYRRWEKTVREAFSQINAVPHFVCINDDARTTLQWAEQGFGIALAPDSVVHMYPDLHISQIEDAQLESHLCLVKRRDVRLNASAEKLFAEFRKSEKEEA